MKAATFAGFYQGRKVYRVPVQVRFNSSRLCCTIAEAHYSVIAYSASDAANLIRSEIETAGLAETEIEAFGPKGGITRRYVGWYSVIGAAMFNRQPEPETRNLF